MLVVFWILLFLVSICLFLLLPGVWIWAIYSRYAGVRAVTCPENRQPVAVSFNALRAGITGLSRRPALGLNECTRWPERSDCGQKCIPEAVRRPPYTQGEVARPRARQVYHLPVLIAAAAAWVLGAVLHSQYLFREQWMQSIGLTEPELWIVVHWLSPHLITLSACVLFAYGIAALLAWTKGKGVGRGLAIALGVWGVFLAICWSVGAFHGLSRFLLDLEIAYTFVGSLIIGSIVGGLSGKLVTQQLRG